jgi:hypothetical protein
MNVINMATTVEFPEDRVYNKCKAFVALDSWGHITITYIDNKTGNDLVMVYLGKEEIQKVVQLYMDNHDLIEREGEKEEKEEEKPDDTTKTPIPILIQPISTQSP